ncbi:MAG: flagellar hook-associated protein FlgL [Syntrophomonadaceae bacterium]|jgi:flagellar hook-associated protein 3 FlgL|nr:flagellar hook-associated protein FlgL [Syntrophomonadaceae bacterium]
MRVTNSMMANNLNYNLNQNLRRLERIQTWLSTTKYINRPSDDPSGIVNTLRYTSYITEAGEYLSKIAEARNFLNTTDSALANVTDILHRANELTIQGINGTNPTTAREAIAIEMRELQDQIRVIANTTFGSKHIFAGTNVTQAPMQDDPVTWTGNDSEMYLEIGVGTTIPINSTIKEVFFNDTDPDNPGIYQLLGRIADALENEDVEALNQDLGLIQERLDSITQERAVIGAKVNRLDLQETRLENTRINYEELLSKNQDADLAEVIMQLKMQENVYRASLAAGARIIMPSLVDFLR